MQGNIVKVSGRFIDIENTKGRVHLPVAKQVGGKIIDYAAEHLGEWSEVTIKNGRIINILPVPFSPAEES